MQGFIDIMTINTKHELIPSHLTTKRPAQIKFYFFSRKEVHHQNQRAKIRRFLPFFRGKPLLAGMDPKKYGQKNHHPIRFKDVNRRSNHLALIGIYCFGKNVRVMPDYAKFREINTISPRPLSYWLSSS